PAKDRVVPHLVAKRGGTHVLQRQPSLGDNGPIMENKWAGAGFQGGTGSWAVITGTWDIPMVSQPSEPAGPDGGWDSSSWVGIDGFYSSTDVLQAGISQNVDRYGTASYYAWFEWHAPAQAGSPPYIHPVQISNFP